MEPAVAATEPNADELAMWANGGTAPSEAGEAAPVAAANEGLVDEVAALVLAATSGDIEAAIGEWTIDEESDAGTWREALDRSSTLGDAGAGKTALTEQVGEHLAMAIVDWASGRAFEDFEASAKSAKAGDKEKFAAWLYWLGHKYGEEDAAPAAAPATDEYELPPEAEGMAS